MSALPLNRILVVHKLQRALNLGSPDGLEALRARSPERADHHARAAEAHRQSLARVRSVLADWPGDVRFVERATDSDTTWADVVVTVGGDGTLLAASHAVGHTPLLAVNSAPEFSVGHFAEFTANELVDALGKLSQGRLVVRELTRIRICINGAELPRYALNEVLFAHQSPAGTSRYTLCANGRLEPQRSSGVWIATGAGSTAAIWAAGGQQVELCDNRLQFLVREPCSYPDAPIALLHGFTREPIRIVSEALASAVYLDGPRRPFPVELADEVTLDALAPPLRLVGKSP